MPVSGIVLQVNPLVMSAPELINEDAYDKGWLIRIKMVKPAEADLLLTQVQYEAIVT